MKKEKATKFLFEISFDNFIKSYQQMTIEEMKVINPLSYVEKEIDNIKDLASKYPYDGVVVSYSGLDTIHMQEKDLQVSLQQLFVSTCENWIKNNSTKEFIYKGNPQTIFNKTILNKPKFILLPTENAKSKFELSFMLSNANISDIPTDRFVVLANSTSLKEEDRSKNVGYFSNRNKSILETSEWILSKNISNTTIKGLAMININNDYFNINKPYITIREAIDKINPSLKN